MTTDEFEELLIANYGMPVTVGITMGLQVCLTHPEWAMAWARRLAAEDQESTDLGRAGMERLIRACPIDDEEEPR